MSHVLRIFWADDLWIVTVGFILLTDGVSYLAKPSQDDNLHPAALQRFYSEGAKKYTARSGNSRLSSSVILL